jgi:non-specific serine/threonine protein kinase
MQAHVRRGHGASFLALFNELRALCDLEVKSCSSAKLDRILEVLGDIEEAGEKAVVFSYLLAPLHELSRRLKRDGKGHAVLVGDMVASERDKAVARFKQDRQCNALLASSKVASEGLTLVEANHVIFVNRWWNPSANAQARDRVVRIGQKKTVWVWTFVCRNTIETRLGEILSAKEKTFDDLVEEIGRAQANEVSELFVMP